MTSFALGDARNKRFSKSVTAFIPSARSGGSSAYLSDSLFDGTWTCGSLTSESFGNRNGSSLMISDLPSGWIMNMNAQTTIRAGIKHPRHPKFLFKILSVGMRGLTSFWKCLVVRIGFGTVSCAMKLSNRDSSLANSNKSVFFSSTSESQTTSLLLGCKLWSTKRFVSQCGQVIFFPFADSLTVKRFPQVGH